MKDLTARLSVVIGSNYGDCGKGLITDYLSNENTLVVRFNGGAQAGHTVVTPERLRHVFGHFGSGTLRGAPTFLSPFFVVNPILFVRELGSLLKKGITPKVYIDNRCIITTPYDMMFNQELERQRGKDRHGSCGVGFGATVERNQNPLLSMDIHYVVNYTCRVIPKLKNIRKYYKSLFERNNIKIPEYFDNDGIIDHFMDDLDTMMKNTLSPGVTSWSAVADYWLNGVGGNIVFEGAQGLALDMDSYREFPHVTRSNTGIKNVMSLLNYASIALPLDIRYVTRSYFTRHGAGTLSRESTYPAEIRFVDHTNVDNEFQGKLRFAPLNYSDLIDRINLDKSHISYGGDVRIGVAITCLDQMTQLLDHDDCIVVGRDCSEPDLVSVGWLVDKLQSEINTTLPTLTSYGATREDIR